MLNNVCYALSPLSHNIAAQARRRLEQGRPTNFHPRASVDAGENYKVGSPPAEVHNKLTGPTSFMAHPENMLPIPDIDEPVQRFLSVVKFYLSGWHIKPP